MKAILAGLVTAFALTTAILAPSAQAQTPLQITPLAEKKIAELPSGELFWRIETFPTAAQAQNAAGKWALVAESAGRIWLFTLGSKAGRPQAVLESPKWVQYPALMLRSTAAHQRGQRTSRKRYAGAQPCRFGSVLCSDRAAKCSGSRRSHGNRGRPPRARTRCQYANAGFEHWLDRSAFVGDVRGRRQQAIFVARQIRVTPKCAPTSIIQTRQRECNEQSILDIRIPFDT